MSAKQICKKVCLPLLIIAAFYSGGVVAGACEYYHTNLFMSCSVFTATFAGVLAMGAKIYHFMFV